MLDGIILGQLKSDNNNRLIELTDIFVLFGYYCINVCLVYGFVLLCYFINFQDICECKYDLKQNEKSLAAHLNDLPGPTMGRGLPAENPRSTLSRESTIKYGFGKKMGF